jgi:hypothetical protein
MAEEHMLTTSDNPWNPFSNYDEWYTWDTTHGYNTSSFLARITKTSVDLSDADYERAIEDAIEDAVTQNVTGVFVKAVRPNQKQSVVSLR